MPKAVEARTPPPAWSAIATRDSPSVCAKRQKRTYTAIRSGDRALRRGGEVGPAGSEVYRHRNMLEHYLPVAFDPPVDVRHPYRQVCFASVKVGADEVLDAVRVGQVSVGSDREVAHREGK